MRFCTMTRVLTPALLLIAASASTFGSPVRELDVVQDATTADAICVGRAVSNSVGEPDAKGFMNVSVILAVDRVSKGDIQPGAQIVIRYLQNGMVPHVLTGCDLVFLKREGEDYTYSRPALSSIPVSTKAYSHYVRSADVIANLRWEILNSLRDPSPLIVREALGQTGVLTHEDFSSRVKPLTISADLAVRALALTRCSSNGDENCVSDGIQLVVNELETVSGSSSSAVVVLASEIESHPVRENHIAELGNALKSKSDKAREFAARVLRFSASRAAVPHLKQALEDSSQMVRYNAVMGLSDITKDYSHAPATSLYKDNEDFYLQYWRGKTIP